MGEKPLSIDEAPAQPGTIMGAGPPDVVDVPPPGVAAGSISTTRSNIKSGSGVVGTGDAGGSEPAGIAIKEQGVKVDGAAMEGEPIPGADVMPGENPGGSVSGITPVPGDDEVDPTAGAAGINTTRSNIKNSGGVVGTGDAGGSEPAGIAIKEQGIKVDGAAMEGEPIPGADVKPGENPGGSVSGITPVPGDDEVDPMAGAAGIITTRSNIKGGGRMVGNGDPGGSEPGGSDATPAGDAGGVAGISDPIPGVDIIVKKPPPR